MGEPIDRFTTIDMYRRPATNIPGRIVMDYGRPGDGYYAQRNPSKYSSWQSHIPQINPSDYAQVEGSEEVGLVR